MVYSRKIDDGLKDLELWAALATPIEEKMLCYVHVSDFIPDSFP